MAMEEINLKMESLKEQEEQLRQMIVSVEQQMSTTAAVMETSIERSIVAILSETEEAIKDIELDIRVAVSTAGGKEQITGIQTNLDSRKDQLKKMKSAFETAKHNSDRARLAAGGATIDKAKSMNDKLARQKETIRQAVATCAETEEVGGEVLENLGRNKEKIACVQSKVSE